MSEINKRRLFNRAKKRDFYWYAFMNVPGLVGESWYLPCTYTVYLLSSIRDPYGCCLVSPPIGEINYTTNEQMLYYLVKNK